MTRSLSRNRLFSWAIALPVVLAGAVGVGCGGGPTSLGVSLQLAAGQGSSVAPGQTATFAVTVTDTGAAGSSGVTIGVDLPADFRFKDTRSLSGSGVRTSPVDAQVNSHQPSWGVWLLNGHGDDVTIEFDALAAGTPGSYSMTAGASGASTGGTAESPGLALKLIPGAQLTASVSVSPTQAVPGDDVTYEVSVFNDGTGPANGLSLMVTLPPVFAYDGGEQVLGNSSRSAGANPSTGTVIAYFDGFGVPAHSANGPGQLIIRFRALVLTDAGALGTYPVALQVLADFGLERVDIAATAPVTIS